MPTGDSSPDDGSEGTSSRNIRRRAVLSSLGVAGTTFIAGCGGDSDTSTGTEGDGDTGGQGDTQTDSDSTQYLVADLNDNPPSLDPHTVQPTANNAKMVWPGNAYETLVFYQPESPELEPMLATEVPTVDNGLVTNDGKTLEFPLREGVQFHTGGEMTAEDVKYSIDRVRTMGMAANTDTLRNNIENVEVVDDYTIRITTDAPRPSFLTATVPSVSMTIMSKDAVEENGGYAEGQRNRWVAQNSVGTGPYQLANWNRGSNIRWDPFEEYWAPDTVGPDGVFQYIYTDVSSSVAAISAGDTHWSGREAGAVPQFEGSGATTSALRSLAQLFFFFNYEIPYDRDNMPDDDTVPSSFFQDPNVRKAFAYSIPFDDYIENVWEGHGFGSNQPCHTESLLYFDDEAPAYEYDADRAEELFKEAGYWEEGFTFTLMAENFAEAANTQLFLKDRLEELNDRFSINTMTMPESQYVARRDEDPWSFTCDAGGFPSFGPDPAPYYDALYHGPPANGTRMNDYIPQEQIDLADEAAQTLDTERRQEIYSELQTLTVENPPHLSLLTEELVKIHLPCVEPSLNPATTKEVHKRWDISQCDPINF